MLLEIIEKKLEKVKEIDANELFQEIKPLNIEKFLFISKLSELNNQRKIKFIRTAGLDVIRKGSNG